MLLLDQIRLDSCIGNREDASAWLEAIPYEDAFSMSDMVVTIALRYRLGIVFPELNDNGILCLHCHHNIIDKQGNHLCGGCGYEGHRQLLIMQ